MDADELTQQQPSEDGSPEKPAVRSLKELVDRVTGRNLPPAPAADDSSYSDPLPFPFLALVGQEEMKLALLLALINPAVGGVLLIGPRGTGKTTAVRSLLDLLPEIERSTCPYGCLPQDIETGGIDAVCPDCARKYGEGISLTHCERMRLTELPLNASLDDVVGGLDERAAATERARFKRGILANADLNVLYIDEVNLLASEIIDAILDAAAAGSFTVRRGTLAATYRSRFTLIGSMNLEEGTLRPQILDRFGLRVPVHGLTDLEGRLETYRRVQAYRANPRGFIQQYRATMLTAKEELKAARELLPEVQISDALAVCGIQIIQALQVGSLRAEITLFEAARAHAAADGRTVVTNDDLRIVAPLALRFRRGLPASLSQEALQAEDEEIRRRIDA
jgi:magnesium chelatase subunit I